MPRYIDADELIEKIESCTAETWGKGLGRSWWSHSVQLKDNVVRLIKNAPEVAVDAAPERTAYWVVVRSKNPTSVTAHRCSNPECRLTTYAHRLPPYCQECGSKMIGKVKEDDENMVQS